MPSQDLFLWFQEHLTVIDRWIVSGTNYQKTAEDWLVRMDGDREKVLESFERCYGIEAGVWVQRWRLFYLAVAEVLCI